MARMIYKEFQGLKISTLGMGCMRLPVIDGKDADIDEKQTFEMVDLAFSKGINYFDTAWGYHAGNSETVLGKALSRYPRESFFLADKFPGYDLSNMSKVEEIFEKQLEKCGVSYFDFYLFHNVCELNIDSYLNPEYGVFDYLMKQKENGRIRHLGFSAHGSVDVIRRFLEAYGSSMEFCMIQLNWVDEIFQNAADKLDLLREYGIPVWVMEPLRGGSLLKLAPEDEEKLRKHRPDESVRDWAFRYILSIPEVVVTLSGMSSFDQMKENIATFEEDKPLSAGELETLRAIAEGMIRGKILPCTACRYCTSYCPKGLDIPKLLSLYNENRFTGGGFLAPLGIMALPEDKRPQACIGCRKCEKVCPQTIMISEIMKEMKENIKPW